MKIVITKNGFSEYPSGSIHEVILKMQDNPRDFYYLLPSSRNTTWSNLFPEDTIVYRNEGSPYLKTDSFTGYWISHRYCVEIIENNKDAKFLLKK